MHLHTCRPRGQTPAVTSTSKRCQYPCCLARSSSRTVSCRTVCYIDGRLAGTVPAAKLPYCFPLHCLRPFFQESSFHGSLTLTSFRLAFREWRHRTADDELFRQDGDICVRCSLQSRFLALGLSSDVTSAAPFADREDCEDRSAFREQAGPFRPSLGVNGLSKLGENRQGVRTQAALFRPPHLHDLPAVVLLKERSHSPTTVGGIHRNATAPRIRLRLRGRPAP